MEIERLKRHSQATHPSTASRGLTKLARETQVKKYEPNREDSLRV